MSERIWESGIIGNIEVICILNWCFLSFRSINYDEKDPFLCNACGFCKYARFDFMLYARPCCAVDPIENEEDRKKVSIHSCEIERTQQKGCHSIKSSCMVKYTLSS